MKKGVIYARYSSDTQREESIEAQIRECSQFAHSQGIDIINTYCDRAISARSDNRPSFQRMINDSYNHLFDYVIVWKSDRFSRNRRQALDYRDILTRNGIRLLSCTEPNIDGPEQILYQGISDSYNEYYSVELARKIKRGNKQNVLNGHANGGVVPFGFKLVNRTFILVPEEAEIVKKLFSDYTHQDCTISKLVRDLKERGIKNHKGEDFKHGSIYHLLRNEKYIGIFRWGEDVNENCIPPIIEKEVFEMVQVKLSENKARGSYYKSESFILSRKLRCGECGALMIGESGTSKTGRKYYYYKCQNAKGKNRSCHFKPIPQELIETFILSKTIEWFNKNVDVDIFVDKVMNYQLSENPTIKELQSNIEKIDHKMSNIMKAIEDGMDATDFKIRYSELKAEKETLLERLYKERATNQMLDKNTLKTKIMGFKQMDYKDKGQARELIDTFVHDIYVFDDGYIDIVFIYTNLIKRTSLDELLEKSSVEVLEAPPLDIIISGKRCFFLYILKIIKIILFIQKVCYYQKVRRN